MTALFDGVLPTAHPDLDAILADPAGNPSIPAWHPPIERYIARYGNSVSFSTCPSSLPLTPPMQAQPVWGVIYVEPRLAGR